MLMRKEDAEILVKIVGVDKLLKYYRLVRLKP